MSQVPNKDFNPSQFMANVPKKNKSWYPFKYRLVGCSGKSIEQSTLANTKFWSQRFGIELSSYNIYLWCAFDTFIYFHIINVTM